MSSTSFDPFAFAPDPQPDVLTISAGRRHGVLLCYPLDEKRLASWEPPFFADAKLDGERCRQLNHDNLLVSSELTPIISMPHITRALEKLGSNYPFLLDGELYRHGWKFEEIHSCVSRTVNPHPSAHEIKLHVYDYWNQPLTPQFQRRADLQKMRKFFPPEIVLVPTKICYSLDDVLLAMDSFVSEGYEGIVVRHPGNLYVSRSPAYRSPYLMKFKPKKSDTYEIVEIHQAYTQTGKPKGILGSFSCRDREGNIFSVSPGIGLTDSIKRSIYSKKNSFVGRSLLVEYQNLTSERGVPRFGRAPLAANKKLEIL
jgi:ATP-dependent DNA ligase